MTSDRAARPGSSPVVGRPLSVAIVGINFAPEVTGIGPYTFGLARGLSERGFAVAVHTGMPHYPQWRKSTPPPAVATVDTHSGGSLSVTRVDHHVPPVVTARGRARMELSFAARSLITGIGSPDVIVVVSPPLIAAAVITLYGRLRRIPVGLIVQDLYSLGAIETGLARGRTSELITRLESWCVHWATSVVVIHDRFARSILTLGIRQPHMVTIRNWTHVVKSDGDDRDAVRRRLGWDPSDVVAVHSGNMGVKQGLENVVDAARLAADTGSPVRFVLIGDGNQRSRVEALAAGIDTIFFVDPLPEDEYMAALGAADVLLVNERPGVADMAAPSKLTSYFASGRPVIAAVDPSGVTADEIARSGAGVTVPPADPESLLTAVLALGRDADAVRALADNGGRYAGSVLDADHALDAYADWCRGLVGGAA